jgi:glycosyltransferase involved in cell wall biosynthesis
MLEQSGTDEFWVALNGAFPDSTEAIQSDLAGLLPPERFITWRVPGPTAAADPRNAWRASAGEVLREALLEALHPDWIHLGNLFQGYADDSLETVPTRPDATPVAVTHHDLIPLVYPNDYITSPQATNWYYRRLESLRRAPLVLTNSEFTRNEAIETLDIPAERVVCISCAASSRFAPLEIDAALRDKVLGQFGIERPFVMYTGGADPRKNVDGLIRAFSLLPAATRRIHQLVLVGKEPAERRNTLLELAHTMGLVDKDIVFTGLVSDDALVALYNLCNLFAFPSFREGFGLPVLEAMACGTVTIASNTSSLPEVVGWEDALFDPHSDEVMAKAMHAALTNGAFRSELARRGLDRAKLFTWKRSARRALDAMRAFGARARTGRAGGERVGMSGRHRLHGIDHAAPRGLER